MMPRYILAALLVLAVIISGCAQKSAESRTGSDQLPDVPSVQGIAISIVSAPAAANAGAPFAISWEVEGAQKAIPSTAIYYDTKSHAGTLGEDSVPEAIGYAKKTQDIAGGAYQNIFSADITPDKVGTLYLRAHAVVDGRNYWTDEKNISVRPWAYTPQMREFRFIADDYGFYYANNTPVYFISVIKGDYVKMTLDVRSTKVSRGSLDFKGCGRNATGIKAGESTNLEFAASTCAIASYWPNASLVKSALEVIAAEPPKASPLLLGRVLYYLGI